MEVEDTAETRMDIKEEEDTAEAREAMEVDKAVEIACLT